MTTIPMEDHDPNGRQDLRIWNCDLCRCVHLCAAKVLLTFTREEYAAFAHAVAECYFGGDSCARRRRAGDEFALAQDVTEAVN